MEESIWTTKCSCPTRRKQRMNNIYTPPNCRTLDTVTTAPQIRLGIQGYGGVGKTWSALTFPNPIVLNMDRGLGCHTGRADIIEVPFYEPKFSGGATGLKDKLIIWLDTEARKLSPEQTLVIDGGTSLQNAYHRWYSVNQVITKTGRVDDFAEWKIKKDFYGEIMEMLKTLPCNVVFIWHEADKKDKDGSYSGKIRPLLTGQFGDELMNHFTDFFRQLTADKPTDYSQLKPESLKLWDMTGVQFKAMCDTYPRNTIYYWQLESDSIFDGKCSSLVNFPRFLSANYNSFRQYQRINQTNTTIK